METSVQCRVDINRVLGYLMPCPFTGSKKLYPRFSKLFKKEVCVFVSDQEVVHNVAKMNSEYLCTSFIIEKHSIWREEVSEFMKTLLKTEWKMVNLKKQKKLLITAID